MLITIIGPDGTGKTSVREIVCSQLCEKYPDLTVKQYERRFEYFPSIWKLLGKRKAKTALEPNSVRKHNIARMSVPKSLVIVIYYTIEYALYWLKLIFSRKAESKTVHVFSRYWYDYYFGYAHSGVPVPLLRLFEAVVPRPDLILFINRPPADIWRDKPELTIDEIGRQQNAVQNSPIAGYKEFVVVDATMDLKSTAAKVLAVVCRLIDRTYEASERNQM